MKHVVQRKEICAKNGNFIGILKGKVLQKIVKGSKHKYRSIGPRGSWGIDYDALFEQLPELGTIQIEDTEEGAMYSCSFTCFRENGVVLHFKDGTKDHNTQVFLPLEYFDVVRFKR